MAIFSQIDAAILGLEHFIDKSGYQSEEYQRRSIKHCYYVLDKSGLSAAKASKYKTQINILPMSLISRARKTVTELAVRRPKWIELYDTGRLTIFYTIAARLLRIPVMLILRGNELWNRPNQSAFRRHGLIWSLKLAKAIVAKEQNILDDLGKINIPKQKIHFVGNCVPLPHELPDLGTRSIDIVYMNAVRAQRNVDALIHSIPKLLTRFPNANIVIAGFTHLNRTSYSIEPRYELEIMRLIHSLGLKDKIRTMGFVPNPDSYFKDAKLFVLPADIIFANYSLLESMSYGVVPIVADGEGAAKIVNHGVNGLITKPTPSALAEAMASLLDDDTRRREMAILARRKIDEDFSIRNWGEKMTTVIRTLDVGF